jgi:Protein of unknown function (DUF1493)
MNDDELLQRIRLLVQKFSGRALSDLCLDSDLHKSVGISGDDAHEFLQAYMNEFSVDMSDFRFDSLF